MEFVEIFLLQMLTVACYAENIDTRQPIMRVSPDVMQEGSLFGYSLAIHQIAAVSPGNFDEATENTRIVISAPKRSTVGGQLKHTGAVYVCPVRPGDCQRSSNPRLYDIAGNSGRENKTNQFLGSSMASDGEHLIVCAHHFSYVIDIERDIQIPGRCFASTSRDLRNFDDFQPCRQVDMASMSSAGFCQVGISSVILPGPVYGLGAPGYYAWRGTLISMTSNSPSNIQRLGFGVGTTNIINTADSINYQGYTVTSGYFSSTSRLDYAVSVPRFNLYTGAVHIIVRDNGLTLVSQPALRGMQMGEGYGFSVLGANFAGDSYSELLVGAPFYRANKTQADVGRVFIYSNNRGSLSQLRVIVGFKAFSRFGYAMANLGDITGDGYDDIAIGAPFSNSGESGIVYIYHSSSTQGLTLNPQQTIVGSQLSLSGVTDFRGFGSALVSGIDVDGNTYNDLAIGAFESQRVFLLRTRPNARTTTSFTASPQIVNLERQACLLRGRQYACFDVNACAQYSGPGLSDMLSYTFVLTGDTRSIEKRVFFNNNGIRISEVVQLIRGSAPVCRRYTVYIINDAVDLFNPFIMEFDLEITQPQISIGGGNLPVESFDNYPVLQRIGTKEVQVESQKDCGGMICIPDLRISVQGTTMVLTDGSRINSDTIVVGGVRNVQVRLQLENAAEDAFQAAVTITIPPELEFGRVIGEFSSIAMETLTCTAPIENNDGRVSSKCSIGNPFRGPQNSVIVIATLIPQNTLTGNENDLLVSFNASSINNENLENLRDGSNEASATLRVTAVSDISLDSPGIVSPEQLTYSRSPPNGSITRVEQLGPKFSVSFVVRNSGPSTVRNIKLVIHWPLNGTNSEDFYYLYPAQFSTSETGSTITCSNDNVHPDSTLSLADINGQNEEGTPIGTTGRRRKRSIPHTISKRQPDGESSGSSGTVDEDQVTINRTISCAGSTSEVNCVPIECTIIGLQGTSNSQARVTIIGYADERFFSRSIDRYSILPHATIAIIGEDYITQPNPDKGKSAVATVRLIPAASIVIGERTPVPWWVIVLPILAAIIIIVIVAVILWALGFFKRKKHEQIKQQREGMQNTGGSTENMLAN